MPDDLHAIPHGKQPESWKELASYGLIALGALSLLRTSRLLGLALAGAWIYDVASRSEVSRRTRGRDIASKRDADARLDAQIEDTFPSSDPPSYSGSTAGAP